MIRIFLFLVGFVMAAAPRHYRQVPPAGIHTLTAFQTNSTIFAGAGGTSAADNINIWKGVQSNRLTVGNAASVLFVQTLSPAVNVCADSFFRVTFRIANKSNVMNLNRMDLYLANNATNFITYEFGSFGVRDSGLTYWGEWSQYHTSQKKFTATGSFDCAAVDTVIIALRAEAGVQDTVTLGEVAAFPRRSPKATLIINEDDQWASWFTNGIPKLDSLGFRHTMFINGSRVGQVNFATEAQIDNAYRRGSLDVGNHLWAHDSATDYTADSLIGSIRRNYNYIRAHGWKRGPSLLAYPFGRHNRLVDSIVRVVGQVDFARTTKNASDGESQQFNSDYALRLVITLGNTIDTTSAKALIDTLVAQRTVGGMLVHQIGAVGCTEDGNTWCKDHWLTLMNYVQIQVAAGRMQVMSLGDYLEA